MGWCFCDKSWRNSTWSIHGTQVFDTRVSRRCHVDATYTALKLESLRLGLLKVKPSLRYSIFKCCHYIHLAWSCLLSLGHVQVLSSLGLYSENILTSHNSHTSHNSQVCIQRIFWLSHTTLTTLTQLSYHRTSLSNSSANKTSLNNFYRTSYNSHKLSYIFSSKTLLLSLPLLLSYNLSSTFAHPPVR